MEIVHFYDEYSLLDPSNLRPYVQCVLRHSIGNTGGDDVREDMKIWRLVHRPIRIEEQFKYTPKIKKISLRRMCSLSAEIKYTWIIKTSWILPLHAIINALSKNGVCIYGVYFVNQGSFPFSLSAQKYNELWWCVYKCIEIDSEGSGWVTISVIGYGGIRLSLKVSSKLFLESERHPI